MRGVTAFLVLILAACFTAGGDTTTTGPIAEPSTTTIAPTTTTTAEPTTKTVEQCVERDGALRNRRGFVCPPHLVDLQPKPSLPQMHLPGTYETRLLTPPLRFTRISPFATTGEHPSGAHLDVAPNEIGSSAPLVFVAGPQLAPTLANLVNEAPINRPDDWVWATDTSSSTSLIGGIPADVVTFTADCWNGTGDPDGPPGEHVGCFFNLGPWDAWNYWHGQRVVHMFLTTSGGPTAIAVIADGDDFDAYWTETVQPILNSIEFIDQ